MISKKINNSKGQAAVTDALFFLLIVMGLVSFLFFFSSQYGRGVSEYAKDRYASDYATSSLKTILYSSTPRNPSQSIDNAEEIDFLMAAIKEDYASDGKLDTYGKPLGENIEMILSPMSKAYNYIFYLGKISGVETHEFPYVFLHITEFTITGPARRVGEEQISSIDVNYLCSPASKSNIDAFVLKMGATAQSFAQITMPEIKEEDGQFVPTSTNVIVGLAMWTPAKIDKGSELWTNLDCKPV